jgi:hypothetical protein
MAGKFYKGDSRDGPRSTNASSTFTVSLNKNNVSDCNSNAPDNTLSMGDHKPCTFYNERTLTREV